MWKVLYCYLIQNSNAAEYFVENHVLMITVSCLIPKPDCGSIVKHHRQVSIAPDGQCKS